MFPASFSLSLLLTDALPSAVKWSNGSSQENTENHTESELLYSLPAQNGKERKKQKRQIRAELQRNPEVLHYDFNGANINSSQALSINDPPSDIQFHTQRICYWRDVTEARFSPMSKETTWKQISSGKQLNIPGKLYANFYDNGTVMIQGPQRMQFVNTFDELQEAVNIKEFAEHQESEESSTEITDCRETTPDQPQTSNECQTPQCTSTPNRTTYEPMKSTANLLQRFLLSFTSSPQSDSENNLDAAVRTDSLVSLDRLDDSTPTNADPLHETTISSDCDTALTEDISVVPETQPCESEAEGESSSGPHTVSMTADSLSSQIILEAEASPTPADEKSKQTAAPVITTCPPASPSGQVLKLQTELMDKD